MQGMCSRRNPRRVNTPRGQGECDEHAGHSRKNDQEFRDRGRVVRVRYAITRKLHYRGIQDGVQDCRE